MRSIFRTHMDQCGLLAIMESSHVDELFALPSLGPISQDFCSVLLYCSSLDVRHTNRTRLPVGQMWVTPITDMESFCDVGA